MSFALSCGSRAQVVDCLVIDCLRSKGNKSESMNFDGKSVQGFHWPVLVAVV